MYPAAFGLSVYFTDVTARKQVELERDQLLAALDEERQRLRLVMEQSAVGLAYLDADFRIRRANTRFAEYVGRTREAVLGTSLADVAPDGSVRRLVGQVKRRGGRVDMKAMSCSVSPQPWRGPMYYDWSLVPLRGRRGPPRGYVVSVIDVTAQTVAARFTRPWSASAPRSPLRSTRDASSATSTSWRARPWAARPAPWPCAMPTTGSR